MEKQKEEWNGVIEREGNTLPLPIIFTQTRKNSRKDGNFDVVLCCCFSQVVPTFHLNFHMTRVDSDWCHLSHVKRNPLTLLLWNTCLLWKLGDGDGRGRYKTTTKPNGREKRGKGKRERKEREEEGKREK